MAEYIIYFSTPSAGETRRVKDMVSSWGTRALCVYLRIRRKTSSDSSSETGSETTVDSAIGNPYFQIMLMRSEQYSIGRFQNYVNGQLTILDWKY